MTPYEIELLLHFYTSSAPPRQCPILQQTIQELMNLELLKPRGQGNEFDSAYMLDERGLVFCDALTDMQLPVKRWEITKP